MFFYLKMLKTSYDIIMLPWKRIVELKMDNSIKNMSL